MKPSTIAILAVAATICLALFFGVDWRQGTPAKIYTGRIQLNLNFVKSIDGTTYNLLGGTTTASWRLIHGNKDYNDQVGTINTNTGSVTGEMRESDKGTWYLIWDPATNVTAWLDVERIKTTNSYVTRIFGEDGDIDGFQEVYMELGLGGLAPTSGYETRNVDLTILACPQKDTEATYTSLTNASGITATYSYVASEGYFASINEGDMLYLGKIELDFSASGNSTYPDTDKWMLTHLKVGPYALGSAQFGSYDLANTRYQIKFGDQINFMSGGKKLYYAKNAGTLWCPIELKAYCAWTSAVIQVAIKFYYYQASGVLSSADTYTVTFTAA